MNRTELTNENKAKFFAQYYGQKVLSHIDYMDSVGFSPLLTIDFYISTEHFLLLTPLSLISDEDAKALCEICGVNPSFETGVYITNYFMKPYSSNINSNDGITVYQYLQSKGYALSWMGLSIDQLVESGWVQLKTN